MIRAASPRAACETACIALAPRHGRYSYDQVPNRSSATVSLVAFPILFKSTHCPPPYVTRTLNIIGEIICMVGTFYLFPFPFFPFFPFLPNCG